MVDEEGKTFREGGWSVGDCNVFTSMNTYLESYGPGYAWERPDENIKYAFGKIVPDGCRGPACVGMPAHATRYNFATGMWCDDDNTRCEDFSENPG